MMEKSANCLPLSSDILVLTCAEMAAADAHTIASGRFSGAELMERAGAAVNAIVLRDFSAANRIHILCGPGNNGGDGYVVGRLLRGQGLDVSLYGFGIPSPDSDAALAARRFGGPVYPFDRFSLEADDLVIDAVFGAGYRGQLPEPVSSAIAKADNGGAKMIAVDLPSGVSGDGGVIQNTALYDATVTFYCKKPAHCLFPSRRLCGTLHVADIGVRMADNSIEPYRENRPELWQSEWPALSLDAHKYSRGHVAVFSGPRHATGASRLSAMAAQRAGAGAVTLLGQPSAIDIQAHHVTSIMTRSFTRGAAFEALDSLNAVQSVVLGPGFGDLEAARDLAIGLLKRNGTVVLDADALTALAAAPDMLYTASHESAAQLLMTPHEGEFQRLFPDIASNSSLAKHEKAIAAAQRANAIVVYKGPDTVIASPDGRAVFNTHATPALATAGSGDVLAGLVASLAAQGMAPFEAACAAVWLHAETALNVGPYAIADDLVILLPRIMAATFANFV